MELLGVRTYLPVKPPPRRSKRFGLGSGLRSEKRDSDPIFREIYHPRRLVGFTRMATGYSRLNSSGVISKSAIPFRNFLK